MDASVDEAESKGGEVPTHSVMINIALNIRKTTHRLKYISEKVVKLSDEKH